MKRVLAGCLAIAALSFVSSLMTEARADGPSAPRAPNAPSPTAAAPAPPAPASPGRPVALQTWGQSENAEHADSPVRTARDLLVRSRRLDDRAASEEKAAAELQQKLPALRASAKATRERAERAAGPDREVLVAVAEDLETDLAISEAETLSKKREAGEDRLIAHELRVRAMRLIHERPAEPPPRLTADGLVRESSVDAQKRSDHCDPPFRFTPDGRKTYLFECLK